MVVLGYYSASLAPIVASPFSPAFRPSTTYQDYARIDIDFQ